MSFFNELEKFELGKDLLKKIAELPYCEECIAALKSTHMGRNASCNLTIVQCEKGHIRFEINKVYTGPTQCFQCAKELGLNKNMKRIDSAYVKTLEFLVKYQTGDWKEYIKSKEVLDLALGFGTPDCWAVELIKSEWYQFFEACVVPVIVNPLDVLIKGYDAEVKKRRDHHSAD